jgi:PAS domain S-box-containing protein
VTIRTLRGRSVNVFLAGALPGGLDDRPEAADRPYRVLVKSMQQGATIIGIEGTVLYSNPRIAKLLGLLHGRLTGTDFRDVVPADDRPAFEDLLRQGPAEPAQGEVRLRASNGSTVPVHLTFGALPAEAGASLCILVTDLTERKHFEEPLRTQAALKASDERFRLAADAMSGVIYERDADGRVGRSSGLLPLLGYAPKEVEPTVAWWSGRVHPEDRARLRRVFRAIVADRSPSMDEEYRVRHRDGHYIHVLDRSRLLYDDRGRASRIVGYIIDVSELVRTEEALRDSDQRLRMALRAAQAGVWDWVLGTGKIVWSPEMFDLFGNDPKEVVTRDHWERHVNPDDRPALRRLLRECLDGKIPEYHAEFRVVHPRRGVRWLLGLGLAWRSSGGVPTRMAGINLDVTERREIEEFLRESDRRREEFLAMLAHELRNPLAGLSHAIQLLRAADLDEASAWAVDVCGRQVVQLTRLIDDLLGVSRINRGKLELEKERVELGAIVE